MISHEECWRPDGQRWETVQVGDHRFFKARINTLEIATLIERSWNGKICKLAGQRREPAIAWPSHQNGFREDASRTVQSQDHSEIPSRRVFCNHPWRDTMQCWTWRKIAVMQLSLKASRFFFSLSRIFSNEFLIPSLVVHTTIIKRSNDYCFHYHRNILELTATAPARAILN